MEQKWPKTAEKVMERQKWVKTGQMGMEKNVERG